MMSIRLMGEDSVDGPLWDDDGLMFTTAEELLEAYSLLGLSVELVAALVSWAREWPTRSGEPAHDAEAARLVRQLRVELGHGVGIVYKP